MTSKEKLYTVQNLDAVYQKIKSEKAQHKVCSYRIQVDGLTVVKRTYNLSEFYTFRHSVTEQTKKVSIRIYGRFRPVEEYELQIVAHDNVSLMYENLRLFSETLDKDVEIFTLREKIARMESGEGEKKTSRFGAAQVVDLGDKVLLIVAKDKLVEAADLFEEQLNASEELLETVRSIVEHKKS